MCSSFGAILSARVSVDVVNGSVIEIPVGTYRIFCVAALESLLFDRFYSKCIATMSREQLGRVQGKRLADGSRANKLPGKVPMLRR